MTSPECRIRIVSVKGNGAFSDTCLNPASNREFRSSILDSDTDFLVSYSIDQGQRPAILFQFLEVLG
jgi:hypothetical protein